MPYAVSKLFRRNRYFSRGKLLNLLKQQILIATRSQAFNLKLFPVLPHHIQGLRANGARGAEYADLLHAHLSFHQ